MVVASPSSAPSAGVGRPQPTYNKAIFLETLKGMGLRGISGRSAITDYIASRRPSLPARHDTPLYAHLRASGCSSTSSPPPLGRMTSGRSRSMAVFMIFYHCCKDSHVNEADGDDFKESDPILM